MAMRTRNCTFAEPNETARAALTRAGTRVIEDLSTLQGLEHSPWLSRYVQGLVDVPFLNLTPGTRSGIVQDERYAALVAALEPLESHVKGLIEEQQRAEEEQASQQSLKAIQKAFHEAMLALPREEYDWFDVQGRARQEGSAAKLSAGGVPDGTDLEELLPGLPQSGRTDSTQLVRLYVKELMLKNFAGASAEQLLERMIQLSLYAEEKLKSG
jgi:hypothetical protein